MNIIGVMHYTGNVGKSSVAKQVIFPRLAGARLFAVESINSNDGGEIITGKEFDFLHEALQLSDTPCIVDVGASNIEPFLSLMKQMRGSHEDYAMFVVPVVADKKVQMDTMALMDELERMGVPAKKIKLVFNRIAAGTNIARAFAPLIAYHNAKKNFVICPDAAIEESSVFDRIKGTDHLIHQFAQDKTDYRAQRDAAKTREEKLLAMEKLTIQQLSQAADENLDKVFKALFPKTAK